MEMREINVGSTLMLAAKGNAPETLVKVLSINGRWVRVAAEFNGAEANVAAKDLSVPVDPKHFELNGGNGEDHNMPKNGVVPASARARYVRTKIDSGTYAVDCADEVAVRLRGMELIEVYKEAANILGESIANLEAKYSHLNAGMQRMSLGNRIRKALRSATVEA